MAESSYVGAPGIDEEQHRRSPQRPIAAFIASCLELGGVRLYRSSRLVDGAVQLQQSEIFEMAASRQAAVTTSKVNEINISTQSRFTPVPYLGNLRTSPRHSNTTPHPYWRPRDSKLDRMDSRGTNVGGLSSTIGWGHPDRQPRLSASTMELSMYGGEPSKQRRTMFLHPVLNRSRHCVARSKSATLFHSRRPHFLTDSKNKVIQAQRLANNISSERVISARRSISISETEDIRIRGFFRRLDAEEQKKQGQKVSSLVLNVLSRPGKETLSKATYNAARKEYW